MGLGHIYVLRHPSRAAGFKVGKTTRDVQDRLRELNADSTLVGGTMELIGYWIVLDVDKAEKAAHRALSDLRKQANREFFGGSLGDIYKRALVEIKEWVLKEVGFEEVQKETPTNFRSSNKQNDYIDFRIATESEARFVINEEYRLHFPVRAPVVSSVFGGPVRSRTGRPLTYPLTVHSPMQLLVDNHKDRLFHSREAKRVNAKIRPDSSEGGIGPRRRSRRKSLILYAEARYRAKQSVYAEVQSGIGELATAKKYTESLEALAHQRVLLSCFEVLKEPEISFFDEMEGMGPEHERRLAAARMKLTESEFGLGGELDLLEQMRRQEDAVEAAFKRLSLIVERRESKREEETVRRWLGSRSSWQNDPLRPR